MTDLNSILDSVAGGGRPATSADVAADVARGRRALRGRRMAALTSGTFALMLAAGVVVAQQGGAFDGAGSRVGDSVVAAPSMAFVAYTGDQPAGFTVATVPSGWALQAVDEYSLVIAPPGLDTDAGSFLGKLLVGLESLDAAGPFVGTDIDVAGRPGVVTDAGDGYKMLHWTTSGGHRMNVQWPPGTGWTDREVADFAAGVAVTSDAKPTRG